MLLLRGCSGAALMFCIVECAKLLVPCFGCPQRLLFLGKTVAPGTAQPHSKTATQLCKLVHLLFTHNANASMLSLPVCV